MGSVIASELLGEALDSGEVGMPLGGELEIAEAVPDTVVRSKRVGSVGILITVG